MLMNTYTNFTYVKKTPPRSFNSEQGIALIMVLVVLFVLTVVGLASTDSSNLQSVMVRNNQFRLEAFNASMSEINDQMEFYVSDNGKAVLFAVIDNGTLNVTSTKSATSTGEAQDNPTTTPDAVGTVDGTDATDPNSDGTENVTGADSFVILANNSLFDKDLTLQQEGGCAITLNSLGGFKKCSLMRLDSDALYQGTNIGSDQSQQFSFESF